MQFTSLLNTPQSIDISVETDEDEQLRTEWPRAIPPYSRRVNVGACMHLYIEWPDNIPTLNHSQSYSLGGEKVQFIHVKSRL